jgi:hypothetical protein
MRALLALLFALFLLLLLVSALLPFSCPSCSSQRREDVCPVSGRAATQRNALRHGGKCYSVGTCSKRCHEALQQDADEGAFSAKYSILGGYSAGSPGLHLRHPQSKAHLQFAPEVPCGA